MKKPSVLILASLAICPVVVVAEEGPAFDCAKAVSAAEKLICADTDLAALDRRLAGRFDAAVGVAKGLDVGAEETTNNLTLRFRVAVEFAEGEVAPPDVAAKLAAALD